MGTLIIADRTGHRQIDWAKDKDSIAEATKLFNETLKNGYFAVAYNGDASVTANGRTVRSFDETADEIKMLPNLVGG